MHVYVFIHIYINLTKMYHYMLKHHLQLSRMMNDENVNITFEASGSNNQDGSHHQDMLTNVKCFLRDIFKINNCAHMYMYIYNNKMF